MESNEDHMNWVNELPSKEMMKREYIKLKKNNRRYRKLKKGKRRSVFCFLCFLAVIAGISIEVFQYSRAEYVKKLDEQRVGYSQDYQQWKNSILEEQYNRCWEEKLNAALSGNGGQEEINAYLSALKRQELGLSMETLLGISCYTSTTGYELSEYIIAGDGNTVIFPGAVLKGESLFQGSAEYTLLPLERTPMSFTSNQPGGYTAQAESVDYRNVSEILNSCAKKNEGQTAKEWNYCMQVIRSNEELEATLGIQLPSGLAGMEFGASEKTGVSSVAVIYRQTYYTVSAEPKKNAAEYFQNEIDLASFGAYEPVYVSSVDYGRMVVVLIQGNMSAEELGAKVSACINGVSIGAGLTNIRTDTSLTSNIYQYGGEQKDVGMITDSSEKTMGLTEKWNEFWNGSEGQDTVETRINDFISTDAPAVNPVPIAYTLKYLTDNSYVPAMVISDRKSLFTEQDMGRKVTLTTSEPVLWENTSPIACIPVYSDDTVCEFVWDSDDITGVLQGKVVSDPGASIGDIRLVPGNYLPNGKNGVVLGNYSKNALFYEMIPVTVDVVISSYSSEQ